MAEQENLDLDQMTEDLAAEDLGEQEQAAEAAPEKPEAPSKPPPGFVPQGALHEQRAMNKELKAQLAAMSDNQRRMEETFQKMLGAINEKPAPTYDEDPLGHMNARNATLEKEVKQLSSTVQQFTKETSQRQAVSQINDSLVESEAEFRQAHPDYDAAVKHLKDITRSDLGDQGLSGAEIEQTIAQGKLALANAALQQGKNPAEVLYERAKRYGYRSQGGKDTVATIAAGQKLGKTVEGGTASGMTLRDLAQLSDDQIDSIIGDEKKFQALIRGQSVR